MPFCTNCGAQVELTDLFCGECGTKVTKPSSATKPDSRTLLKLSFENKSVREYSGVLSWVLDEHIRALTDITQELVPYFDSLIVFEENTIVSVGNSWWVAESSPELLLYRMPIVAKTDNVYTLDNLSKYRDLEISDDTKVNLRSKFRSLLETYYSTLGAMEAIFEVTKPIRAYKEQIDKILREEDLKNIDALQKYEIYISDFLGNLEKTDWSKYPSGGLDGWRKKADEYGLNAGIFEGEDSKVACPYSNDLGIDTDVERCMVSYFSSVQAIHGSYNECRDVFLESTRRKGLLGGIPGNLRTEGLEKLTFFNMYVNALYYPLDYCNDKSAFFESNLKQFLESKADIIVSDEKSMKNIFNIISMLNGMYPVNTKWGPVIFTS
jgi:hypothetical protein